MGATAVEELRGRGELRLFGTTGNNYVSHRAAASVTGAYDISWPGAAPGSALFLQMDASGNISYVAGAGGTLDQAYDSGGAGAGRVITADSGPVEIGGADGLMVSHTDPFMLLETTGAQRNWRIQATSGNLLTFERGDLDADATDDTFDTVMTINGASQNVGIGTAPSEKLHISDNGGAKMIAEGPAFGEPAIIFTENSVDRWNLGYSDSFGGFMISAGNILVTDALFIEDSTLDIGINETSPDARLHVTDNATITALVEATVNPARLALRSSTSSSAAQVGVQADGDDLELFSNGAAVVNVGSGGAMTASNWSIAADGDASFGDTGDAADHSVTILAGGATNFSDLYFGDSGSGTIGSIRYLHGTERMSFATNGTGKFHIDSNGNIYMATAGSLASSRTLVIENGTAPVANVTDSVQLYAEDVTASSELKVRDEAGNITVLSPHSEPHGHRLAEDMGWSFYSERDGRYIWVDMLRAVRALEKLSGEKLAYLGEA